jgi:hypothetical protein
VCQGGVSKLHLQSGALRMPIGQREAGSDAFVTWGRTRCELALNGMHRRLECCAGALRGRIRPVCRCSFPIKILNKSA